MIFIHNRIKKYSVFEIITLPELKNTKNMPVQEQKSKEGKKILQSISNDDYVILLDEKGKEFRTIEFSGLIEKIFYASQENELFLLLEAHGDFLKRFMQGLISKCLFQK